MLHPITFDASFKLDDFLDAICNNLFAAEFRRIALAVDRMHKRNIEAHGEPLDGFIHNGDVYDVSNLTSHGRRLRKSMHFDLLDDMDKVVKDQRKIHEDRQKIRQIFFSLCHQASDMQELHDTLPDCVHQFVPKFQGMTRKFDQSFIIHHDARGQRQYEKYLPLIEQYSVSHLLY